MLNITRKPGEQLRIGDTLLVTLKTLPGSEYAVVWLEDGESDARVLKLEPGDKHRITEQLAITLTEIRQGEARLAIDAPREIEVYREEVYQDRRRRRRRSKRDPR